MRRFLESLPISRIASAYRKARSDGSQVLGHALRGLPFADEGIGTGGLCSLVTGVQMTDQDYHQSGWTGNAKSLKS